MASMTAQVATTTQHCRVSHRAVAPQAQARSFTSASQKPTRAAARPALRLNSRRNVKTYAQDTETAAGALMAHCHLLGARTLHTVSTLLGSRHEQRCLLPAAGPVTDSTFEELVLKSPVPVLVDFWAPWCGPCRMIAPLVDELAVAFGDKIKAVNEFYAFVFQLCPCSACLLVSLLGPAASAVYVYIQLLVFNCLHAC